MKPCCPPMVRGLAILLLAVPLVIIAISCSPSASTPAGKPSSAKEEPTTKKEPGADPR
ncbi:MAG: hypothetical protein K2R98_19145 [Gemmataceae bacterium]|nr:hypothetical protein [Gemmataceae bacterium]